VPKRDKRAEAEQYNAGREAAHSAFLIERAQLVAESVKRRAKALGIILPGDE
jgi:hypothetical protein